MYYLINKNTRELVRTSDTPFNIDERVQPPAPLIQLKGVDDQTMPTFDSATQKLNRTFRDDDAASTRTYYYEVVALSAAELATVAQAAQDEAVRQQIKSNIAALKAGTGTAAERLVRIEKALAYLLRNSLQ